MSNERLSEEQLENLQWTFGNALRRALPLSIIEAELGEKAIAQLRADLRAMTREAARHSELFAESYNTLVELHAAGVEMRKAQDAWFDGGSLHEADASEAVFDAQLEAAGKLLKEEP